VLIINTHNRRVKVMNMSTIEEVVIALEEMMSGHGNAIEQMSRSGKG